MVEEQVNPYKILYEEEKARREYYETLWAQSKVVPVTPSPEPGAPIGGYTPLRKRLRDAEKRANERFNESHSDSSGDRSN